MRISVSKQFTGSRELLFRHFAQFEDFAIWSKFPEGYDFELLKSDTGEIKGLTMTYYIGGEYWRASFESVFSELNRETQTRISSLLDPQGNEVFGTEYCLFKEMSSRTQYIDKNGGTEIRNDLYLTPARFSFWLDSYLLLRDWRKRSKILMILLDDYLSQRPENND